MKHFDDIQDDEIRIISRQVTHTKPFYRRWWFYVAIVALALLVAMAVMLMSRISDSPKGPEQPAEVKPVAPTTSPSEPPAVHVCDTFINDVPLHLYTPVNVVPELCVGVPDTEDISIRLALQAADIRADNQEIVGAFVLKGELLSKGSAKKGFCAILGGKIYVGMGERTSLLEETITHDGYFFRQYPLVSQGHMVESKPKNKAVRRALCEVDGQIVVVCSKTRESFHDFSQALVDLGVQNAIYLTGGYACGFCRDIDVLDESWGDMKQMKEYPNVNFILWRSAVPNQ